MDDSDEDLPFPPRWVTLAVAVAGSAAAIVSLLLWALSGHQLGGTDRSGWDAQFPFAFAGLVTGWLAYVWTEQGHYDHATVAEVATVTLFCVAALLAFA